MAKSQCYLCGGSSFGRRPGRVRDNQFLEILECQQCGLVQLSTIEHIGEGHYEKSGMHGGCPLDPIAWRQRAERDDARRHQMLVRKVEGRSLLDFGCGPGGFLEMIASSAKSISGIEVEEALHEYLGSRGIKVFRQCADAIEKSGAWDIITAFHVLEHMKDPRDSLVQLGKLLKKGGELIVEVPNSNDALLTLYQCKEFQEFSYWSQHLYLFNEQTLETLVGQSGLKLQAVTHIQRYPVANHMHWLAKGKPGGERVWDFLDDEKLNFLYEKKLAEVGLTDTILALITR